MPGTNNFAANGVMVHNCEDISKGEFDNQIAPIMMLPDVRLAHRGYTHEQLRREKVSNRNMELLRRSLIEQPGRKLSWVMAQRDCLTITRWHLQAGGTIEPGDKHHQLLAAGVAIHLEYFAEETATHHHMSMPIFNDTMQLLSKYQLPCHGRDKAPFEVAFGALGSAYPGGLENRKTLDGKSYWFVDDDHFKRFVATKVDWLLSRLGNPTRPSMPEIADFSGFNQTVADLLSTGCNVVTHIYSKHPKALAAT